MGEPSKVTSRARSVHDRSQLDLAERAAAGPALQAAVQGLLPVLPPGPVAAYASVGTEPSTRELLAALLGGPRPVLLPLLLPDGDLDWAVSDGDLRPGPRGLLSPPGRPLGPDAVARCALVVVPALAVDRAGTRLGRGGGSYDRALVRTAGLVVAALHRGELVERLPADPHDQPVHAAVVPGEGLVVLRPHPAWSGTGGPGGMAP